MSSISGRNSREAVGGRNAASTQCNFDAIARHFVLHLWLLACFEPLVSRGTTSASISRRNGTNEIQGTQQLENKKLVRRVYCLLQFSRVRRVSCVHRVGRRGDLFQITAIQEAASTRQGRGHAPGEWRFAGQTELDAAHEHE